MAGISGCPAIRERSYNDADTGSYVGDAATLDWSDAGAPGLFSALEVTVVNEMAAAQGTVSTFAAMLKNGFESTGSVN